MERNSVVYQVVAGCINYPDAALLDNLPTFRAALPELSDFYGYLENAPLAELQRVYVATFDLNKRHSLYLSYWTDGDTRRRGQVLADFKKLYRESGMLVSPGGELPDFLPIVLEYAAIADPVQGRQLLLGYRPSLELMRLALLKENSPYLALMVAVCGTLPGASPTDTAQVMRMAGFGPPSESVGLDPYDPRLLPLQGTR